MASAQTMTALELANATRIQRALARRSIYAVDRVEGCRALADLIEEMPAWLEGETVGHVLDWPRRMGSAMAHRLLIKLSALGVSVPEGKRLGDLTERQHTALRAVLRNDVIAATPTRPTWICRSCLEEKPYSDFPLNSDGGWYDDAGQRRRSRCRACEQEKRAIRYRTNEKPNADPRALPVEPFAQWLERKYARWSAEHPNAKDTFLLSLGIGARRLDCYLHREQATVSLTVVDRVLTREGSTNLAELYEDLYPDIPEEDLWQEESK